MRSLSLSLRTVSVPMLLACVGLMSACSGNNENNATVGEACALDVDCAAPLVCRVNLCTQPGGTTDPDSTSDMPDSTDSTIDVKPESYYIAYVKKAGYGDDRDERHMFILDTSINYENFDFANPDGQTRPIQVTDNPLFCLSSCWMTPDLKSLVYLRPSANGGGLSDIYVAPVNGSLKVDGEGTAVVQGVLRPRVQGDTIIFVKTDGTTATGYYRKVNGTEDVKISDIGPVNATQASVQVDTRVGKTVLYQPTLQQLEISFGTTNGDLAKAYTIDGSNFQETGGSFFNTNVPTAFSADGKYMALITTAPNDYNPCTGDGQCAGVGQFCGLKGYCTVRELSVRFFDFDNVDKLGQPCTTDAICGGVHECYIPSAAQLSDAVCIPRRVVLGLPSTPAQPAGDANAKSGCENTKGNAEGRIYTNLIAPMSFDDKGNLYVTAQRQCDGNGELNISDTDIVKLSPRSSKVDVVFGKTQQNFVPANCYDGTPTPNVSNCSPYIAQARLSPGSNEMIFLGTNPQTNSPESAEQNLDMWTVLLDGTMLEWNGGNGLFDEVLRFDVMPK